MAGLLDILGIDAPEPYQGALVSQGLLEFAKQGRRKPFTGLLSAMASMEGGALQARDRERLLAGQEQDRAMRQQVQQLQYDTALAQRQAQEAAAARGARDEEVLRRLFAPVTGTTANAATGIAGPRPEAAAAIGQAPQFDPRMLLAMGGSFDALQQGLKVNEALNPQRKLMSVAPGASVVDERTGQSVFQAPDKPAELPSEVRAYEYARAQGYPGTYQQFVLEQRRAGASSTTVSYGTPVQAVDSAGRPVFLQPTKDGSPPYIIPGVRPPMTGAEEKAASDQATRERQGKQMVSALNEAEQILKAGNATASGIGTVIDAGARAIGRTTAGAQDAARLEALGGWLMANVPRMEGPQSNFDVQNYMTMAGKVGDSRVPIAERMAALNQVKKLQQKYAELNGTPVEPAQPASGGWGIRPLGN